MKTKKLRPLFYSLLAIIVIINLVAYSHAYKFTHFSTQAKTKTGKPEELSTGQKIKTLFLGIDNPKPINKKTPKAKFSTVYLQGNEKMECWKINASKPKGTVVLFHGYSGEKSTMLDKAQVFLRLNFNVLLVDFSGSGGSEGKQITIGYKEAYDVKVCVDYLKQEKEQNIVLFGTSMGAVAIMKAMDDYGLPVSKIILECPFGTMLKTVKSRFSQMGFPSFPMAYLLVFWGGAQNGFNAFKHNPVDYAKNINCPTLLLYGEKDKKVSRQEINSIFSNLKGEKYLKTYPNSGHENYLLKHPGKWKRDVGGFLLGMKFGGL